MVDCMEVRIGQAPSPYRHRGRSGRSRCATSQRRSTGTGSRPVRDRAKGGRGCRSLKHSGLPNRPSTSATGPPGEATAADERIDDVREKEAQPYRGHSNHESVLFPAADAIAEADGEDTAGAEHLLLAALDLDTGSARRAFERVGADPDQFRVAVREQHADAVRAVGMRPMNDDMLDQAHPTAHNRQPTTPREPVVSRTVPQRGQTCAQRTLAAPRRLLRAGCRGNGARNHRPSAPTHERRPSRTRSCSPYRDRLDGQRR